MELRTAIRLYAYPEERKMPRKEKRTGGRVPIRTDGQKTRKAVRKDGRVKSTLLLSESLDFRLAAVAKHSKRDISDLAEQLLDGALRRYALDAALRDFLGCPDPAEPDESSAEAA